MDEAVKRWYKLGKLLHWGSQILPRKVVGIFNWKSYPSIFIFGTWGAGRRRRKSLLHKDLRRFI